MLIGVLALQGDFGLHRNMLSSLNVHSCEVRRPQQLDKIDGLIIPGGESTTFSLLLEQYDFIEPIKSLATKGMPIWGTCAGAIILGCSDVMPASSLSLIDIKVFRNGYGRQIDSFAAPLKVSGLKLPFQGIFIRAPRLADPGEDVHIIASYRNEGVMARQQNILVTTFHPELTADTRIHQYFLKELLSSNKRSPTKNILIHVRKRKQLIRAH